MMKIQSYERVSDKGIVAIKTYLLDISEGYWLDDIHELVNFSIDGAILKRKLNRRRDLQIVVFSRIKKLIDESTSFNEMEQHLIYLNLLLDNHFAPLLEYKYRLLNHIVDCGGFNIETYCLLRHLIKYNQKNLIAFIEALAKRLDYSLERYHYLATHILLLEKQYKHVYKHLAYIKIDQELEHFMPALYNYSPRKYHHYGFRGLPMDLAVI